MGFTPERRALTDLEFAEALARRAHATQRERFGGAPYVEHLARVAAAVDGDEAQTIAWLHDVVEDTPFTLGALYALFPARIAHAVDRLTRRSEFESYATYIASIARGGDNLTAVVKRADLRDHLRADGPVISASLRTRYTNALCALNQAGGPYA